MLKKPVVAAIMATLFAHAWPAASADSLFPPDVIISGGGHPKVARLREKPWWGKSDRQRPVQGIRLFVAGVTLRSWSIRLEQGRDGAWTGNFREHDGRRLSLERRFKVKPEDIAALQVLMDKAQLWKIHPQFWQEPDEGLCLDGETLIFERLDSAGYRYSQGVQPCSLDSSQMAVAERLALLAGEPDLAAMFR